MTTAPEAASCADAHDCTDHDHGPTGAEVVSGLIRGLSLTALAIPVLAAVLLVLGLALAPTTPLPLLLGLSLGALQLLVVLGTALLARGPRRTLAHSPLVLVLRCVLEETLRLGAALLALALWPFELPGRVGVWVGLGAACVWMGLALVQTVAARRRISRPSAWSREAVASLLSERVGARGVVAMRLLDVTGAALFQIGATALVVLAPVLAAGVLVLSIASGMSTLVLQRHGAAERIRSPWAYAPAVIGVLVLALALLGIAAF